LIAVFVVAAGVSLGTTIFTVTNALFFRLPAVPSAEDLVYLYPVERSGALSYRDYLWLSDTTAAFSGLLAVADDRAQLKADQNVAQVHGESVSLNYFAVLGVAPMIGFKSPWTPRLIFTSCSLLERLV
jgi:hypothetical protein